MDTGDIIFYGLIALSAVASIVKSAKKKQVDPKEGELPDFKGDKPGKWIKTILEDVVDDDDDFIPVNPKPETQKKPETVFKTSTNNTDYTYEGKSLEDNSYEKRENTETYRRTNVSLEKPVVIERRSNQSLEKTALTRKPLNEVYKSSVSALQKERNMIQSEIYDNDILSPAKELADPDELKKAIIFGEIMRTKF